MIGITITAVLLLLSSCALKTNDYKAVVTVGGVKYEQYSGALIPNGKLSDKAINGHIGYYNNGSGQMQSEDNVSVQTYEGDLNCIFISVDNSEFLYPIIFHKVGDNLPDITDKNRISTIDVFLPNNPNPHILSSQAKIDYISFLSGIMSRTQKYSVATTDGRPGEGHIETHFKDYPAYDSSVFIKSFKNGTLGINFSETSLNKKLLGDYDNVAILPTPLLIELESN